jgi:proline dehydrogenase
MFRAFFIYLSYSAWLRSGFTRLGLARRMAARFVAGEQLDDAVRVVRALNDKGILATLDHLGENVESREDAYRARDDCLRILDCIAQTGLRSHLSIKLTQLGLDIGDDFCRENVAQILDRAAQYQNFVRIDMEGSPYTQRTLDMYHRLHQDYANVGIVIQSYLYRSEADVCMLIEAGARVRLCKGAYKEPPDVAFPQKADVDANYVKLMQMMLGDEARANGVHLAVATHDEKMIAATKQYVAEHNIQPDAFEFQMLYGIRRDLQERLAAEGYTVRIYVPYGSEWYPYFMRRLAERPANVWFLLSNIIRER